VASARPGHILGQLGRMLMLLAGTGFRHNPNLDQLITDAECGKLPMGKMWNTNAGC